MNSPWEKPVDQVGHEVIGSSPGKRTSTHTRRSLAQVPCSFGIAHALWLAVSSFTECV